MTPRGGAPVWIQEFHLEGRAGQGAHQLFADALRQTWSGAVENDGFNRLVLSAGLSAREIVILRAYCKLLRQAGSSFSQAYMEDTLNAHPQLARLLVRPVRGAVRPGEAVRRRRGRGGINAEIAEALEQVENLDEDRILRAYLLLIGKTLRTNFYQRTEAGSRSPISR